MRVVRDVIACPPDLQGSVIALGNFDGVHLGHQSILEKAATLAKEAGCTPAVMTFRPHPREFFAPHSPSLRLTTLREKITLFAEYGMAATFLVRFNANFAQLGPQAFVEEILHGALKARHIVTGYNFAFGKGRAGDTEFLAAACARLGMGFTACDKVENAQTPISSSAVRAALTQGDAEQAAQLLGRAHVMTGRVIHGQKRGRSIGVPTANLMIKKLFQPRYGVYAARLAVRGADQVYPAVVNVGVRPTVCGREPLLEAHLLDADVDLYGQYIRVELLHFIRAEQTFDDLQALKTQIAEDMGQARAWLGHAETEGVS